MILEISISMLIKSVLCDTSYIVILITEGKLTLHLTFSVNLNMSFINIGNDYIHNNPNGNLIQLNIYTVV